MDIQKPIIDVIKMRTSSRTYDERKIDSDALKQLKNYIEDINSEKKIKGRFLIVQNDDTDSKKGRNLGTYGFITGANTYIVGILDKEEQDALTFGYLFEKVILFATDLGIQTCWLGGTFNKSDFQQNVTLEENEFIPIVSPIGYRKEKPRVFESTMRTAIGANKRKPWSKLFYRNDLTHPLDEQSAGRYNIPLEMVRIGPSASNKQPWRIIQEKDIFHFYLCRTKGYGVADYDIQMNDIGIAKCHFELSAMEIGLKGEWKILENVQTPAEWEYVDSWTCL